ncbi:V-type ATPase, G subunit [Paracoccidioides brasiliensis Pb18]|uniref:V-type ATPase, G subunit n=1 Tax=Paracoccidioides brasiliensis (strain Pb18) TaxID=502780 RepID=C1GAN3_PARBD|nr:V-type ATPase, G subunit [Paracoccidioides brasiliensis Pb18]EEH48235.2 V-type ATPase, G subunit [Paracoccidioides brasiliensis Pb18]
MTSVIAPSNPTSAHSASQSKSHRNILFERKQKRKMSAQNSAGIQTLLDAEREAQKIVQNADLAYLIFQPENDARAEAQKEIEEYRQKKEEEFKKFEAEHSSGNKVAEDEANKEAEAKVQQIRDIGKQKGSQVVEDLIQAVIDVQPQTPGKIVGIAGLNDGNSNYGFQRLGISVASFHPDLFKELLEYILVESRLARPSTAQVKYPYTAHRECQNETFNQEPKGFVVGFSTTPSASKPHAADPRLSELGPLIEDKYSAIRDTYCRPKYPIVLAHGLLGFDELKLGGKYLPGVQYWRGVKEAFALKRMVVISVPVLPLGSIEQRAKELMCGIESQIQGKEVNIIAGLDSRYMISRLRPTKFRVVSLTTIGTPHRGSAFADYVFGLIGEHRAAQIYNTLARIKIESGALSQLTRKYMQEEFNPNTPDIDDVRYFSYGASLTPGMWSVFIQSHRIIEQEEGPNDGLVSVQSSKWGGEEGYKGTLVGVSHLDLINWTNRFKWIISELTGNARKFNALALYLDIAGKTVAYPRGVLG